VRKRRLCSRKDGKTFQQARRPRDRFQCVVLKAGFTAIANPASDREQEFDARRIGYYGELAIVVPLASNRSGTVVTAMPPEQLGEKIPSVNAFGLIKGP
jgi:hypothetical protein